MSTRAESRGPISSLQDFVPAGAQSAAERSATLLDRFPPSLWRVRGFIITALAFGVLCRVRQYGANTSLWHDEAFVALNAIQKSFAGLLGSLDWHEASPPGFLIVEKLIVLSLGRSEYALRLIPLLAGIAAMIGFAGLARQVCGTGMVCLWAILLTAASPTLIAHSNMVKHFSLDILWAVLLVWLAARIWRLDRPRWMLLVWGGLGSVGPWFSFASLFVFAGTSLGLTARAFRDWRWPERAAYLLANLEVVTAVGLLLGPIQVQATGQLVKFWVKAGAFPDTNSLWALVYWLLRSGSGLAAYFWRQPGPVLLVLIVLGSVCWWRTGRRPELSLVLLPVLMALIASGFHRWPFGGNQHMVFAAPAAILLLAEGVEAVRLRLASWHWWVGWAFVALLLLPGTVNAAYRIVIPRHKYELRPVIEFVQRYREPGDYILVFDPAAVEFYAGRDLRSSSGEPDASARVWYISIRDGFKASTFTAGDVLDRLSVRRRRLRGIEEYGAAAYLFGPERNASEPTFPSAGGDRPER